MIPCLGSSTFSHQSSLNDLKKYIDIVSNHFLRHFFPYRDDENNTRYTVLERELKNKIIGTSINSYTVLWVFDYKMITYRDSI